MSDRDDVYIHGHHDSVLRSHRWRTAENSAGYLLGRLNPGDHLLDVGCGPGTITVDLARILTDGQVLGVDREPDILISARELAAKSNVSNLTFEVGDVYHLQYPDGRFDVTHAHQVLQHMADPVAALVEMRRVTRRGGIVAAREGDYGAMNWYPAMAELDDWLALYYKVARSNHGEPDGARHLRSWALQAGFSEVETQASIWCYATGEERQWWGDLWADRATKSTFATQALELQLADGASLQRISDAWRRWADHEDAIFLIPHVEVICTP
jgi:ubiquinone/menaquinone biosynthesis C-methylase UbiE